MSVSPPESSRRHRFSLVTCARWEAAHIVEWLCYHRSIGFDHLFLYCNDDDPAELYQTILPFGDGMVTFVHFPMVGQQIHMYRHFLEHHLHETEWFQFLDVDEFVFLGGHGSVGAFIASVPADWDSIYLNWLIFGPNGHKTRPEGSVLLNYTARMPGPDPHTKTLTRSSAVRTRRVPDPHVRDSIHHHWGNEHYGVGEKRNILGFAMDAYWKEFPHHAALILQQPEVGAAIVDGPCIFHYFLKSEADLERRRQRGVAGDFIHQGRWSQSLQGEKAEQFFDTLNQVADFRLHRYWTRYLSRWKPYAAPPVPVWPNVAKGKQADQSSICAYSRGATTSEDAAGALAGTPDGGCGFHTEDEDRPWWSVDLAADHLIHEVRIYNRFDGAAIAARLRNFDVSASRDGDEWEILHRERGDVVWGGVDGHPFSLSLPDGVLCRFLRIGLAGRGILHLDHVEIFGEPVS